MALSVLPNRLVPASCCIFGRPAPSVVPALGVGDEAGTTGPDLSDARIQSPVALAAVGQRILNDCLHTRRNSRVRDSPFVCLTQVALRLPPDLLSLRWPA